MKVVRILAVAGAMAALACSSSAFAQANMIPMGAGAGVERQPPGSRFRNPTNRPPAQTPANPPAAAQPSSHPPSPAASHGVTSLRCSQLAETKGLRRKERKAFVNKCMENSSH